MATTTTTEQINSQLKLRILELEQELEEKEERIKELELINSPHLSLYTKTEYINEMLEWAKQKYDNPEKLEYLKKKMKKNKKDVNEWLKHRGYLMKHRITTWREKKESIKELESNLKLDLPTYLDYDKIWANLKDGEDANFEEQILKDMEY